MEIFTSGSIAYVMGLKFIVSPFHMEKRANEQTNIQSVDSDSAYFNSLMRVFPDCCENSLFSNWNDPIMVWIVLIISGMNV